MIKNLDDMYLKINMLIDILKKNGDIEYSKLLDDALAGSTSGEILGALRLYIKKMNNEYYKYLDNKSKMLTKDILIFIENAFNMIE